MMMMMVIIMMSLETLEEYKKHFGHFPNWAMKYECLINWPVAEHPESSDCMALYKLILPTDLLTYFLQSNMVAVHPKIVKNQNKFKISLVSLGIQALVAHILSEQDIADIW